MRAHRLLLCACFLLVAGLVSAQERHLYTFTLRHALPEQIVPMLQPQLSTGSSVSGYGQQLILNATDAEYRRISALLDQIDRAPRSLLISVRSRNQALTQGGTYALNGTVGDGAVQIRSDDGRGSTISETRVVVGQHTAQAARDGTQQVRAVEGMAAFINSGNHYSLPAGRGARELTPVTSGFYATARLLDNDEVVVDIDQQDQRLTHGTIATEALRTQVRGRIGEWISLGGIDETRSNGSRDLTGHTGKTASSLSDFAIRVEQVD